MRTVRTQISLGVLCPTTGAYRSAERGHEREALRNARAAGGIKTQDAASRAAPSCLKPRARRRPLSSTCWSGARPAPFRCCSQRATVGRATTGLPSSRSAPKALSSMAARHPARRRVKKASKHGRSLSPEVLPGPSEVVPPSAPCTLWPASPTRVSGSLPRSGRPNRASRYTRAAVSRVS